MKNSRFCIIILTVFLFQHLNAQDMADIKFGKITREDFKLSAEKFDSGANVVILADIGKSYFEGNNEGKFTLIYTRFMRVKVINKNGLDIGKYAISLYHEKGDYVERLTSIKGSTYNLENGIITETKLDEKSIFEVKYNKDIDEKKFSIPALKAGSVFDLQYTIKSPFVSRLKSWFFQGENACLWSEYTVAWPSPFHYMMVMQGDQHFDIQTKKELYGPFTIRQEKIEGTGGKSDAAYDLIRINAPIVELRWVKKNVPSMHVEPYITTLQNYYSHVAFQLNYFQWQTMDWTGDKQEYLSSWSNTSKTLLQEADFGLELNHENGWMKEDLKGLALIDLSSEEKVRRIFKYVRDNFSVTDKDGYNKNAVFTQSSLKEVFKKKIGNVAEINLILTAMLRQAEITADPLILSTRSHGIASALYPVIDEYDYVICVAKLGDKLVTLDASQPFNGFAKLPVSCYNGYGHVLNELNPMPLFFSADSIYETNSTSVFITNDEKGIPAGFLQATFGEIDSYNKRAEIKYSSVKAYQKKIQEENGTDWEIENIGIDSLYAYDYPVSVHYDFKLKSLSDGDIIYFNPMLNEGYKSNPFASMERHYPVEMPNKIDDTYVLNMEIPQGYQVDEIPKSTRVAYNENEGFFEYIIQKGESSIQMRVKLKFNKAFFPSEEYGSLRDFFTFIVKKESEEIVFKKIK